MRQVRNVLLSLSLNLFLAAATLAQSFTIAVGANGIVPAGTNLRNDRVNLITQEQAQVTVQCAAGADCTRIALSLAGPGGGTAAALDATAQTTTTATFTIPRIGVSNGTRLAVSSAGTVIDTFAVGLDSQPPPGDGGGGDSGPTLAQLLAIQCPGTTASYDEAANRGEIVVTPLGVVLASPLDTLFDENDTLVVKVVGDRRLLALLAVARTSAFRTVTAINILGEGVEVRRGISLEADAVPECGERSFILENFAPGQAKVEISALQGTELEPTGTFDFNVNPLYTGMLTLGAARTDLVDPGFKLATVDEEVVIARGAEGENDLVYTLFYTPFVWGRRDVQKSIPWYKRINPSIGVAPDDIGENAFVGITADLPAGFTLTFGRHFGKVEVLTQGTVVGTPFAGEADEIPTATEWRDDNFWAVSIDLRAMAKVLRAALGSGSGSGGGT